MNLQSSPRPQKGASGSCRGGLCCQRMGHGPAGGQRRGVVLVLAGQAVTGHQVPGHHAGLQCGQASPGDVQIEHLDPLGDW